MARKRRGIPGVSFSLKRATGYSAAKGRISRSIGIPLTKSGRQRKAGSAFGCCVALVVPIGLAVTLVVVGSLWRPLLFAL